MTFPCSKKATVILLVLVAAFLPLVLHGEAKVKLAFNKICLLGDSLSDKGRLYRLFLGILPNSPPYYEGRFSNGITWAEHVSQYFKEHNNVNTKNMAVGGATAWLHSILEKKLPITVSHQLSNYYWQTPFSTLFKAKSKTLAIIWIGANDYLGGVEKNTTAAKMVKKTIEHIEECID